MGTTTGEADDRVVVSEGEVRAGELCVAKQHLAELLLAYRGYVILEDALPVDFVRTLARAFQPLYDACTSAAASEGDGRIRPPRYLAAERAFYHCTHQRWRIQPRLVPPMSDPALLANPIVLSLVRARLQASFHCRYVSSDTCAPGAVHQARQRRRRARCLAALPVRLCAQRRPRRVGAAQRTARGVARR